MSDVEISKEARECAAKLDDACLTFKPKSELVEIAIQQAINAAKAPLVADHESAAEFLSEHFGGLPNDSVAEGVNTLLYEHKKAKEELSRLKEENDAWENQSVIDWLALQVVEVRKPMLYGSHRIFIVGPEGDEEEGDSPSDFREQCLKAMKGSK